MAALLRSAAAYLVLWAFLFTGGLASAAEPDAIPQLPPQSLTHGSIGEGANRLDYAASAGALPLHDGKRAVAAKIFYVAYTAGSGDRPITFVFNGGPGAAAAFLHLGGLGPRVVNFTANGGAPLSPVQLAPNPDSWLAFTDLVFVDPVSTGFSRAVSDDAARSYYSVDQDADAMADFIRLFLARGGRGVAPVYLAGESYGGFRAAMLAERLLGDGVQVKGAILISPALELSMLRGDEYALIPLALDLPSIAAAHAELEGGREAPLEIVKEAEVFARTEYLLHLVQGLKPNPAVTEKLARFTGLSVEVIDRHHGRVSTELFNEEYERRTNRTLSGYDGAVSAPVQRPARRVNYDPILDGAVAALTPLMVHYAREELGYKTELAYKLLNREVNAAWDFGTKPNRQGFAGSLDELQKARVLNPSLKIFIAHGYTDLVTTYSVSDFLIGQLKPIDGAAPIQLRVYRGGHMMYMRAASRAQLAKDVRQVYGAAP